MTVNDRPVIALAGDVPLYRALRAGDEGKDVERLQASLRTTGYLVADEEGVFGSGTEAALRNLYAAVGIAPPTEVATIDEGPVKAESAGSTPPGTGEGGMLATPRRNERRQPQQQLVASPEELLFLTTLPASVGKVNAQLGSENVQDALVLRATKPGLRANVNPVDADQLRVGQRVRISTSDGAPAVGHIRSIGAAHTDERLGRVVPVAIEPQKPIQGGSGTELRVTASTLARTAKLFVPTSALNTSPDGTAFVTVVKGDGPEKVEVDILGEANGRTSIQPVGGQLSPGDDVIVGIR